MEFTQEDLNSLNAIGGRDSGRTHGFRRLITGVVLVAAGVLLIYAADQWIGLSEATIEAVVPGFLFCIVIPSLILMLTGLIETISGRGWSHFGQKTRIVFLIFGIPLVLVLIAVGLTVAEIVTEHLHEEEISAVEAEYEFANSASSSSDVEMQPRSPQNFTNYSLEELKAMMNDPATPETTFRAPRRRSELSGPGSKRKSEREILNDIRRLSQQIKDEEERRARARKKD